MPNANAPSASFATYAPFAKGAYGSYNQAGGPAIDGWTPVLVENFVPTNPYFAAQLYTDGQGHYRVAMRGSNEGGDFLGADAALAVGRWNSQLTDAINFVGEAMLQVKAEDRGIAFDTLRESFDCTGHSLGGSLCETAGKFYGLRGMNIDGPGGSAADAIRIRTGDARIISNPRPPSPPRTSNPILPIAASAALVFVPRRQTAAHFTQTKNRSGLAGFHIHLSAYIHRHIAPNRRSRYHFPLSAKTRHQAGSGHPMAARRVA